MLPTRKPEEPKILTRRETRILEAVADRIFPATDTPGAVEAGAVNYIEQALAGDYAPLLRLYRSGLRALDRHARRRFGANFFALDDAQKDAILLDLKPVGSRIVKRLGSFSRPSAVMSSRESSASPITAAIAT